MKNMKYLATVIAITLLMTACSDYPTSGYIDKSEIIKQGSDEVTISNAIGYVFEMDEMVIDNLVKFKNHIEGIVKILDDINHEPDLSFNVVDQAELKNAIDKFKSGEQSIKDELIPQLYNWTKELSSLLKKKEGEIIKLNQQKQKIDSYTSEANNKMEQISKQIEEYETTQSGLIGEILEKTNNEIVTKKIATRKLNARYFSLSYQVEDWNKPNRHGHRNKNKGQCESKEDQYNKRGRLIRKNFPVSQYIHFNQLQEQNICYYIKRPAQNLSSEEYDNYVIDKFKQYINFDTKLLKSDQKKAKKELADAHIIAENQTGISYKTFNKNYQSQKHIIDLIKALISNEFSIDKLVKTDNKIDNDIKSKMDKKVRDLIRALNNKSRKNEVQVVQQAHEQIKFPDSLDSWKRNSERKGAIRDAINKYDQKGKETIVLKAIKQKTKVNKDGSFDGLDGSASFVIPIIKADISMGEKTKSIGLSAFFDVSGENNAYADKSDLVITEKNISSVNKSAIQEEKFAKTIFSRLNTYIKNK
ncbi:MAG: hypothetical protein L3J53_05940 [Proteobacteria bacterium]|nr:hypothetical protein [Pseudomonadota bacterium]